MIGSIIFCIIVISVIAALFFSWFYYQKARDNERMYLLEKGEKLEDILNIQKNNEFKFLFPWLKLGIVTLSLSFSFLCIAFLIKYMENDLELFKGFLITCILSASMGISFIIIHLLNKRT